MKSIATDLPGVVVIEPVVFEDDRGCFMETYHVHKFVELGLKEPFIQDNHVHSKQHVLRGLHFQHTRPQGKLVRVTKGEIFDVAVDIQPDSEAYGRWTGVYLSAENRRQLFIPAGFAHGYCVLSPAADVIYKCTEIYYPEYDAGLIWNDPDVAVQWPVKNPILSLKDCQQPHLRDIKRV